MKRRMNVKRSECCDGLYIHEQTKSRRRAGFDFDTSTLVPNLIYIKSFLRLVPYDTIHVLNDHMT